MKLLKSLLSAAALAAPLAFAPAAPPAVAQDHMTNVYGDAFRSRDAIRDALDAVSAFGAARAAGEEEASEAAAVDMLAALVRARFWLAMLDAEVTASAYSEDLDMQVAQLRAMAVRGFDTVSEALVDNDLDALEAALDDSGDWLNALSADGRTVTTRLFSR